MGSVAPTYAQNRLRSPSEYSGILRMRLNIPSILYSQNISDITKSMDIKLF